MTREVQPLCPECGIQLKRGKDNLSCPACGRLFPVDDGIPIILPRAPERFKERESEYHAAVSEEFESLHNLEARRVACFKEEYHRYLGSLPRGSAILELGCGTGWDAVMLAERGMTVYTSDISSCMVKKARERLRAAGAGDEAVRYFALDAESIPFPSGCFDAVLITAALHHLPSPERCVSEMARVCRPGGIVALGFEPNAWPYYTLFPGRRIITVFLKAAEMFMRSPMTALRKAKTVRLAKGVLIETAAGAGEPHSPGDRETCGFTRRRIMQLIRTAGLTPVFDARVWYLNGFIQEFALLKRFRLPSPAIESFLIGFDRFLAKVPLVRAANWHWNIVTRKP